MVDSEFIGKVKKIDFKDHKAAYYFFGRFNKSKIWGKDLFELLMGIMVKALFLNMILLGAYQE
jgi:hypothetical protein